MNIFAEYKIDIQMSAAFLHTSNTQSKNKIKNVSLLRMVSKRKKLLNSKFNKRSAKFIPFKTKNIIERNL